MQLKYYTGRIALMIADDSLAPLVLDYLERNREDFARWERSCEPNAYTLEYQRQALSAEQKLFLSSRGVRYYIFPAERPDIIIGNISFSYLTEDEGHRCAIGYRIDRDYRRRGYAFEAASFLLPLITDFYHIKRIEADILPENAASIALIEKLGFSFEGIARRSHSVAGVERDHLRYSYLTSL